MTERVSRTDRAEDQAQAEAEDTGGGRRMDPELKTVGAILRLLDDLADDDAKRRVMDYLHARYTARG